MIRNTFVPLFILAVSGGSTENPADGTPAQCLLLDKSNLKGLDKTPDSANGKYIDDGEVLKKDWEPGMEVKAIQYCETNIKTFASIKVFVGNEKKTIPLSKHGSEGAKKCWEWSLEKGDYIREFSYTWNTLTGDVTKIVFKTQLDDTH